MKPARAELSEQIQTEKAEAQAILQSKLFQRSPSLATFLSYICQKYFEGEGHRVKEYSIAVEAFGRSPEFHPKEDPIMRVEASRLRKRLREYYDTEGRAHPVRLTLPPGQYVPVFERVSAEGAAANGLAAVLVRSLECDSLPVQDTGELAAVPRLSLALDSVTETGQHRPLSVGKLGVASASLAMGMLLGVGAVLLVQTLKVRQQAQSAAEPGLRQDSNRDSTAVATALAPVNEMRILAGSLTNQYVDHLGKRWLQDQCFTGGTTFRLRAGMSILNTKDPEIYQRGREGDFRYDIPLKPGLYELRLHFAETTYGVEEIETGGETMRLISVTANGRRLLEGMDVASDANGSLTADIKVFTDISPAADGFLHLQVASQKARGLLNGIEIVPGLPGKMQPVRIVVSDQACVTPDRIMWEPDRYFRGGRRIRRTNVITGTSHPELFRSERHGNFAYTIPVARGRYQLTLNFAETWFGKSNPGGGGEDRRIFDVYCNDRVLLKNFDLFKEAGGENRAVKKIFRGLQSNPQDKLVIAFVPVKNYACVNAIEVVPDSSP